MIFTVHRAVLGTILVISISNQNGIMQMVSLGEVGGLPTLRAQKARMKNNLRTARKNLPKPQRRWAGRLY